MGTPCNLNNMHIENTFNGTNTLAYFDELKKVS